MFQLSTLAQDLRFGLRLLIRDRTFTLAATLTLAVCIGANAAMFSVVRSVLLTPLPFPDSDRVVLLYNSYPNAGSPRAGAAVPDYADRLGALPALDAQALFRTESMAYGDAGAAERIVTVRATPSFFQVVPVQPYRGRVFTEADGEVGQNRQVILSHGFWRRIGGADDMVGRSLRLNGQPFDVVGVLPESFSFLQADVDLFTPAALAPADFDDSRRHSNNWQMLGRLADGASAALVQEQVGAVNRTNDERFPQFRQLLADAGFQTFVVPLRDDVVRDISGALYLLWGGVGFVLILGCVNLANLMIVRSAGRTREMATRHAIGGDIGRLVRQLLTETTTLALVGGVLGLLLAWWATRSIAALGLDQLPRGYEIQLDLVGLGLAAAVTVVVGLVLGLAPAWRLRSMNLNAELREENRGGTAGRRALQVRRMLAMAQVALALVLLIGAGLLLASFRAVTSMDYGFTPDQVVTATVNLPGAAYGDAAARRSFVARALEGLRTIPGVTHVGATTQLPFSGGMNNSVIMAEGYVMQPGESLISPSQVVASDGYVEAMRIEVVAGRSFDGRETADSPLVALVDERLARKFWPDRDPIGRRLYQPSDPNDITRITDDTEFITVIGVVRDVVVADPRVDGSPVGTFYQPVSQIGPGGLTYTMRTAGGVAAVGGDIRRVFADIDPSLPVFRVQPMQAWIDRALIGRRAPMLLASGFGAVALLLAALGIYGVLAYGVSERARELGVRMALGGSSAQVFRLVLRDGVTIVGVGIGVGLGGAWFVGRVMESQLFGVSALSPAVLSQVTLLLTLVAVAASGIPAWRASRINPSVVLGK